MIKQLDIRKRSNEDVVCWRVDASDVAPNTLIAPDKGVMVVVRLYGVTKVRSGNAISVFGLFNPGKNTKLIGGNKPYENIEIFAIDQSTTFKAEWGIAGADAVPCRDPDIGVECKAVAFGEYLFKIENFVSFISAFSLNSEELTRKNIREALRSETASIIHDAIAAELFNKDLPTCQGNVAKISKQILETLNRTLERYGLTAYEFNIKSLDYDPEHKVIRDVRKIKVTEAHLNKIDNESRRDDVSVDAMYTKEVAVPLIKAEAERDRYRNDDKGDVVICPRCGERNSRRTNYCGRCGEKLIGK